MKVLTRHLLTALLLFLVCFAAPDANAQQRTLKIMTYNIHHGNPPAKEGLIDLEAIAEVIKGQAPDLVALQELDVLTKRSGNIDEVKKLTELTGMQAFFSKGIDHEGGEYGIAILSKFKINKSERHPLPFKEGLKAEQRSLAVINVTLPGRIKVDFACTHLDLKDEHRLLQVAEINKILGSRKNTVILAGDFNLTAATPAMRILEQHFSRSCQTDCAPTSPDLNPRNEIDFVMLKKGSPFEVSSHQVLQNIHASDHLPVVVTYTIKN
ncbi:endonuclease/exonuclease/phosphatase family protein [Pedobacter ginsengisoli]|uniref:endonuclease/exonuclease/phosphatase family protein n=1 Tax=Pedobacter ginsengisoli TaxID=363852 RepID=UPI002550F80A|nr:endonuclease/exonuclease/phosphatase family protein [Pedobacter ginsengisoli]